MARVIVMWTDPLHLSADEAESWVRSESGRLLAVEGIERLELARLARASDAYSLPWNWLLEVELLPSCSSDCCVEAPLVAEWLGDLRLLGMRPVVLSVAEATILKRG